MHTRNKLKTLRRLFDVVPLWPLGITDEQSCLQLLGSALSGAGSGGDDAEVIRCAVSLADWTWQFHPLDGEVLPLLRFFQESGADFGPAAKLMQGLAARTAPPACLAEECAPAAKKNSGTLSDLDDPIYGAALLPKAWARAKAALLQGDKAPADDLLRILPAMPALNGLPRLPELIARLRAEAVLLGAAGQNPDQALEALTPVDDNLFGAWKKWRLAALYLENNDATSCARELSALWDRYFWHPNLTLILHDLLRPLPAAPAGHPPPAILLYSWNKCDALRTTLESLRASSSGAAPVFVLDNGSSDGSGEMLRAMRDSWGMPFTLISLPANVGAPAARNWLLSLPEVRAHEYAVFLDDDVILPQGWLGELLRAAIAKPKAGAVGCSVTDHTPPFGIQAADFHLLAPMEGMRSFTDQEENIFPFCQALGQYDPFPFRYTRPCASVTGCCHILSMRSVAEIGTFDVRFNPSQFDDLERDLRLGRNNWEVYYHGPLTVRHMQHSSLRQAMTVRQQAHIMGNRLKLEYLFTAKEAAALRESTRQRTEEDLLRKCAFLDKTLGKAP